jgi:D-xylose transport system ATP-binding protein
MLEKGLGNEAAARELLALKSVSKFYGPTAALSDVDFHVAEGQVVALVGDNGAGKTTLVKIISGIMPADAGEIRVNGHVADLKQPKDAVALGIQTVYQDLALCDNLDTVQNLFLGREKSTGLWGHLSRPAMEYEAHKALRELNVTIRDYSIAIGRLSGGQRQSVAIARAVISKPKIILLDEPTAALGVAQRAEVTALIGRLRSQGLGVIVVSHDLENVLEISDRVAVLRLGKMVADKPTAEWTRPELVSAITGMQK